MWKIPLGGYVVIETKQEEQKYLKEVLEKINFMLKKDEKKTLDINKKTLEIKRYMWNNFSEMDSAELFNLSEQALVGLDYGRIINKKMKVLDRMKDSPYFGRVDFLEGNELLNIYIGLNSINDDKDRFLVYDWRSPIASIFYDFGLGYADYDVEKEKISGEIKLKRQYKVVDGKLKYFFDSSINIDDEILRDVLGKAIDRSKMQNIVSTIQQEQNSVIRNVEDDCLIVEGPAGSGKTSIGLHRIAYLLYKLQKKITANNVLIFSPNEAFAQYISDVLPSLGEENVVQTLFSDYVSSVITEYSKIETYVDFLERINTNISNEEKENIVIKLHEKFIGIVDEYISKTIKEVEFNDIKIDSFIFKKEQSKEIYTKDYEKYNMNLRIEKLSSYIAMKFRHQNEKGQVKGKKLVEIIRTNVYSHLTINQILNKMYSDNDFINNLKAEFNNLVDVDVFLEGSLKNLEKKKITFEDEIVYTYIKGKLFGFPQDKSIKHIVIDEAQDYSKMQFLIIKNIFTAAKYTILGDSNQSLNPLCKYYNFTEILEIFNDRKSKLISLKNCYRNTYEILQVCNEIINSNIEIKLKRHGNIPTIDENLSEIEAFDKLKELIKQYKNDNERVVVILKNQIISNEIIEKLNKDNEIFKQMIKDKEMTIIPLSYAKGLEFANVIMYITKKYDIKENENNLLYVGCSRALHNLNIVSESDYFKKGGRTYEKSI